MAATESSARCYRVATHLPNPSRKWPGFRGVGCEALRTTFVEHFAGFREPALANEAMGLIGTLSNQSTIETLQRLKDRRTAAPTEESSGRIPRREDKRQRNGVIPNAIVAALATTDDALRVRDIHAAVEAMLGGPVSASSVKNCLVDLSQGRKQLFLKTGRGLYRLAPPAK